MKFNIDIVKLQYELFDLEPEAIAVANGVSAAYITELVEVNKWIKNPLIPRALDISDIKDVANATEDYITELKDKLTITTLLKQQILNPSYTKLEALLIYKAIEVLDNMDLEHTDASKNIKILTSVLNELLQNNTHLTAAKEAIDKTSNKVVVQIMNQAEKAA